MSRKLIVRTWTVECIFAILTDAAITADVEVSTLAVPLVFEKLPYVVAAVGVVVGTPALEVIVHEVLAISA